MDHFNGVIIGESLENKEVFEKLKIIKIETEVVTQEHKTPWVKQWTLYTVEISEDQIDKIVEILSKSFDSEHDAWYADFRNSRFHYIIFSHKIFKVDFLNPEEYQQVIAYGVSLGIPSYQLDFTSF